MSDAEWALAMFVGALGQTLKRFGTTDGERAMRSLFVLRLRGNLDTALAEAQVSLQDWTPDAQSLVNAYYQEMVEQLGISLPSSSDELN